MKINRLNIGLAFLVALCCFLVFFFHHKFMFLILGMVWVVIGLLEIMILVKRKKK